MLSKGPPIFSYPQDRIFSTRFHYKIKRKDGQFEKCKVRLVIQGQHMRRKDDTGLGDFEDAFSPVPHASGFRTILALATLHHMLCDHVDISQAFVQGDLLPGDGHNGKVYISPPPGYNDDDPFIVLTETKFSFRCIPVWIGTLLTGLGSKKKTCDNVLTMTSKVPW